MHLRCKSHASRACPERRHVLAAASLLLVLTTAHAQELAAAGVNPMRTARVAEAVAAAEVALARGDARQALELFERAAFQEHASDIEVGLVRSLMQAGDYRKALAFAAHTAGAHANQTAGAALYAWLLAVGGQAAFAQRLLGEVAQRLPGDALVQDVQRRLHPLATATDALPVPPARFAPASAAVGAATPTDPLTAATQRLPAAARIVGTGVLIDQGRRAIAPSSTLAGASQIWLRDGLGRTVEARPERSLEALGLTLLKLEAPLEAPPVLTAPDRDAFPGTPAHAIEYAHAGTAEAVPAWPWLRTGFLGTVESAGTTRRLGIGLPPGPRGGPVFDPAGRLVGMALARAGRQDRLMPVSALRRELGETLGVEAVRPDPARMALDELYERGLRLTLQVIAQP